MFKLSRQNIPLHHARYLQAFNPLCQHQSRNHALDHQVRFINRRTCPLFALIASGLTPLFVQVLGKSMIALCDRGCSGVERLGLPFTFCHHLERLNDLFDRRFPQLLA